MPTNDLKQAIWENVPVLFTNEEINNPFDLKGIVEKLGNGEHPERNLVIYSPKFGKDSLP